MVLSLALGVKASTVSAAWAIGAYKSLAKPCKLYRSLEGTLLARKPVMDANLSFCVAVRLCC